jgi:anthranilate phosphoribosyltransferase
MENYLRRLISGFPLNEAEAEEAMTMILTGSAKPEQIGAMLTALHFRSPVADELCGFVKAVRFHSGFGADGLTADLLDVCGTGGDGRGTFNVSTAVAFVVAGAGQAVAKHGNRAVSSQCGSFDVLEALGVAFASTKDEARASLEKFNISFLYAPAFYPVLQRLGPLRKSLGVRTVFNVMGPLLNPLQPSRQLMGVYGENLLSPVVEFMRRQNLTEAMVVRARDGMDELSLESPTLIHHLKNRKVTELEVSAEDIGSEFLGDRSVEGGDIKTNAQLLMSVLSGSAGACRQMTLLNAAAALQVSGKVANLVDGYAMATESLDSGRALSVLSSLQQVSRRKYA